MKVERLVGGSREGAPAAGGETPTKGPDPLGPALRLATGCGPGPVGSRHLRVRITAQTKASRPARPHLSPPRLPAPSCRPRRHVGESGVRAASFPPPAGSKAMLGPARDSPSSPHVPWKAAPVLQSCSAELAAGETEAGAGSSSPRVRACGAGVGAATAWQGAVIKCQELAPAKMGGLGGAPGFRGASASAQHFQGAFGL